MNKDELLRMAVTAFLAKHKDDYTNPDPPHDYTPPFIGDPEFLVVHFAPPDDPNKVTFVLKSGHKFSYYAPAASAAPAVAEARASRRERGPG